jgi:uncharacterized coiled-coil protein SlyX
MENTLKDLNDILFDLKGIRARASEQKRDIGIDMNKRFAFDDPEDFIEHLLDALAECQDYIDRLTDDVEQVEFYTRRIVEDIEMAHLSNKIKGEA